MTGLQLILALTTTLLGGTGLGVLLKYLTDRRKLEIESDNSLNAQLTARVNKLEADLDRERAGRERMHAENEALLAITRHRLNNMAQCLDALLLLLEQSPDRAQEAVVKIKEMRARQEANEMAEKAAVAVARINVLAEMHVPPEKSE